MVVRRGRGAGRTAGTCDRTGLGARMRRANAWAASPMGRASTSASNEGEGAERRRHHLQCVSAHLTSKKSIKVALWSHDVTMLVLLCALDMDTVPSTWCEGCDVSLVESAAASKAKQSSRPGHEAKVTSFAPPSLLYEFESDSLHFISSPQSE